MGLPEFARLIDASISTRPIRSNIEFTGQSSTLNAVNRLLSNLVCSGLLAAVFLSSYLILNRHPAHEFVRFDHQWQMPGYQGSPIKVAMLADFHFWSSDDFERLPSLMSDVKHAQPDLILLVGDYVERSANWPDAPAEILAQLDRFLDIAPTYAVLGNHENDWGREAWISAFRQSAIPLLENRILDTEPVCIRGKADYKSGFYWASVPIPEDCLGRTITMTHSPDDFLLSPDQMDTPLVAADTHCGQISLPWVGTLLNYKDIDARLHCGEFEFNGMPGLVTGGLGNSSLPLRVGPGTAPRWELIQLGGL